MNGDSETYKTPAGKVSRAQTFMNTVWARYFYI